MNEYLKEILTEMCSRVKIKFEEKNLKNEHWFQKYEWTQKEEKDFVNWLAEYMKNNKEARETLMMFPRKNKRELKQFAEMFCFNYGWRYKDD